MHLLALEVWLRKCIRQNFLCSTRVFFLYLRCLKLDWWLMTIYMYIVHYTLCISPGSVWLSQIPTQELGKCGPMCLKPAVFCVARDYRVFMGKTEQHNLIISWLSVNHTDTVHISHMQTMFTILSTAWFSSHLLNSQQSENWSQNTCKLWPKLELCSNTIMNEGSNRKR